MIVYADMIVLENTIVNLFLLIITMKCARHKYKTITILASAFVGGLYTMVLFIPELGALRSFVIEIFVAYLMIRITSGKMKFLSHIKLLILFLLLTFMLSGICFLFSIKQNYYILGSSFNIKHYSIKYIIISLMIIYIIGSRVIDYVKERNFVNNYLYKINFEIDDIKYECKSFLDTGNELREPVTNLPCILIEKEFIKDLDIKEKCAYYIPYNAIGSQGNLRGIRVNNILINGRGISKKRIDAIVCPCNEKLSKENEFNALLSRGIV
ncbi:MAG TPA: sigma-E processing peptidase SpoIIGA [Clostridium sp.]|nr:sigma-E processing peptidase SpoIIGA [Clostridium sp.]